MNDGYSNYLCLYSDAIAVVAAFMRETSEPYETDHLQMIRAAI